MPMTARTTDPKPDPTSPPAHPDAGVGSQRYVLPSDHHYLSNLSALWSVDPAFAATIEAITEDALLRAESAKDGSPTVAVATPSGGRVYLHSRYRPADEARQLVADVSVEDH